MVSNRYHSGTQLVEITTRVNYINSVSGGHWDKTLVACRVADIESQNTGVVVYHSKHHSTSRYVRARSASSNLVTKVIKTTG